MWLSIEKPEEAQTATNKRQIFFWLFNT